MTDSYGFLSVKVKSLFLSLIFLTSTSLSYAGEADLKVPAQVKESPLLYWGLLICILGMLFGITSFYKLKKLKAHNSMLEVAEIIFETAKTYLIQQGKFIAFLFLFIGGAIAFYFGILRDFSWITVLVIIAWTIVGILGSYGVAWFGIRVNTLANSRMAFASLEKKPLKLLNIPLSAGMSIGVLLICVELIMMLIILLFVPGDFAGYCFIGFAIGESLGASALRIAGGIFTKIADIGSDLMKIVFNLKEDDPSNPGVIADCTGDNAGDSIGPTADGFETYGVTGVALISFILLGIANYDPHTNAMSALVSKYQTELIIWLFTMRIAMIGSSIFAYWINVFISKIRYEKKDTLDFEIPLTYLVWISSILSIILTYAISYLQLSGLEDKNGNLTNLWLVISSIISCGTLGAALIPELTKAFTSTKSRHTREVVVCGREGGPSLTILSGLVSGNFSAFWKGMVFILLMFLAYVFSGMGLDNYYLNYPSIFAFGLVAFGFLGMGPVTIAVDSYGPVTDNAQSIYELSMIESKPGIEAEIEKEFGFTPNFEKAKKYLEENDGAGNTFKATSKPVLIGTAVVGATTMIFSLILVLQHSLGIKPELVLNLLNPWSILGFIAGGSVIYWFSGASIQAVTTGAYKAVEYIKANIKLDDKADKKASIETSKEVVKICTKYAQQGMFNIFIAVFHFALAFAFFSSSTHENAAPASFFVSYLISLAIFGLFQAIFMANAGGCWDNAKKIVEVELHEKNTDLHAATVVGDTVGDPFKDTASVALNPIIKFTTLFGLLAMEIAIQEAFVPFAPYIGSAFLLIALIFVYRSFYSTRITTDKK